MLESIRSPEKLIVFTRYPIPGRAKTRLIPLAGPEGAADIHRRMAEHTLDHVENLKRTRSVDLEIRYDGGDLQLMQSWLQLPEETLVPQGHGDLGQRLERTFTESFRNGNKRVVVIGTDCPTLTAELLGEAFGKLLGNDLVLGPAHDGGYYLIGLCKPVPELFSGIPWGTEKVFELSRRLAQEFGLKTAVLQALHDVDLPEDLQYFEPRSQEKPIL